MWQTEPTPPEHAEQALTLIVTGGYEQADARAGVRELRAYLAGLPDGQSTLWWARQGSRAAAAASVIHCPGRTAMILHSSTAAGVVPVEALAELLASASAQALAAGAALVQVLLVPTAGNDVRAFTQGGFWRLAELIYMRRSLRGRPSEPPGPAAELEMEAYGPSSHEAFAAAIAASYERSLDCPALEAVRSVEDVLAGHRGAGVFRPDLWTLARAAGRPAGVILLNENLPAAALEVVYMGVAPAFRGRGVGRALLERAAALAARERFPALCLAVDAENRFARRLYAAAGFVETFRRLAYVRTAKA